MFFVRFIVIFLDPKGICKTLRIEDEWLELKQGGEAFTLPYVKTGAGLPPLRIDTD